MLGNKTDNLQCPEFLLDSRMSSKVLFFAMCFLVAIGFGLNIDWSQPTASCSLVNRI